MCIRDRHWRRQVWGTGGNTHPRFLALYFSVHFGPAQGLTATLISCRFWATNYFHSGRVLCPGCAKSWRRHWGEGWAERRNLPHNIRSTKYYLVSTSRVLNLSDRLGYTSNLFSLNLWKSYRSYWLWLRGRGLRPLLLSVYYVRCYLVYIYSMLWPCSSEIDDGLSLAGQYAGRG